MADNQATVLAFIEAWSGRDLGRIMSFLAEDCFYHNVPFPPLHGHAEIKAALEGFVGMASEIDWVVHHVAESARGVVLTERTDRFRVKGKWIELGVMGVFELGNGKITAWRDYFDSKQFDAAMAGVG